MEVQRQEAVLMEMQPEGTRRMEAQRQETVRMEMQQAGTYRVEVHRQEAIRMEMNKGEAVQPGTPLAAMLRTETQWLGAQPEAFRPEALWPEIMQQAEPSCPALEEVQDKHM